MTETEARVSRTALELIAFLSGACVMVLEIVGSRLLAPYVGTSIFVWTSLIGVVLGSLSLGYWFGGRLADRRPRRRVLAVTLAAAAVWSLGLSWLNKPVLEWLVVRSDDPRTQSLLAALALFCVPSVLLGLVVPYTVRLALVSVASAGRTTGRLVALSTVGSIVGTFSTGFVLVAHLSHARVLQCVAGTLCLAAFVAAGSARRVGATALLLGAASWGALLLDERPDPRLLADVDTPYSRVWVYEQEFQDDGDDEPYTVRFMRIGNENTGAMYVDFHDLAYEYAEYFHLARHYRPGFERALIVGGGTYSYPREFLTAYDEATLDVVEIDPVVTALARECFELEDDPRLTIHHADGRAFLERVTEPYDVVLLDAYRSYSVLPHHLVTREALQAVHRALTDDGIVIANLLGVIEGPGSELFRAVYGTFADVFEELFVFPVEVDDPTLGQNLILVACKAPPPRRAGWNPTLARMLQKRWKGTVQADLPVLVDDYAPVERYLLAMLPIMADPVRDFLESLATPGPIR